MFSEFLIKKFLLLRRSELLLGLSNIVENAADFTSSIVELNVNYNNENIEHQKKDGQCGIYSLYFIIQLLRENKTPQFFLTKRVTDELMKDYRNI